MVTSSSSSNAIIGALIWALPRCAATWVLDMPVTSRKPKT